MHAHYDDDEAQHGSHTQVDRFTRHVALLYSLFRVLREINVLIVSITKFSIVIGSSRAYLSRNRRAITWVSNYRCPI